jgi:hypothetical protein
MLRESNSGAFNPESQTPWLIRKSDSENWAENQVRKIRFGKSGSENQASR